jgi:hypothetical protein
MFGDPGKAAQYWGRQSYNNDCVLMSVADVVGQITGHKPTEDEIIELAENSQSIKYPGWPVYTRPAHPGDPDSSGAATRDIEVLMSHYGIHVTNSRDARDDAALDALKTALAERRAVMVTVTARTIWYGEEPGTTIHEVVVTGVDTANGIVHLNDSDNDNGRDYQVAMDNFMRGWQGGDFDMTVTQETVK